MNAVRLLGRVLGEPRVAACAGARVLVFDLETSDPRYGREAHHIAVDGPSVVDLAPVLAAGQRLLVEGRLRTLRVPLAQGEEPTEFVDVVAERVLRLEERAKSLASALPARRVRSGGRR